MLFLNDKCKKNEGFTLIELCISMTVISLILVGVLAAYEQATRNAARIATRADMRDEIESALAEFVTTNLRYPCPADPSLVSGDTNYGREGACGTGNPLIGALPTVTLKLPEKYMLDHWARQYTYVVSPALVVGPIQTEIDGSINLTYRRFETAFVAGETVQTGNIVAVAPQKTDGTPKRFQALVISHGDDGIGTRTSAGGPVPAALACPITGTPPMQSENCDGDNDFVMATKQSLATQEPQTVDDFQITSAGINYFDDMVLAIDVPSVSIWQYHSDAATSVDDVFTKAAGVGIGTQSPDTQLEVSGNARALEGRSSSICTLTGNNECFDPNIIGGSRPSMSCGEAPVVGIRNSAVVCGNIIDGPPGTRCPVGQYVTGFDASGNITCG